MLGDLAAAHPEVGSTFEEASAVLGYDLWQLCAEGPEADLNETERTQPALLAAGVAAWRCWTARGGATPAAMAGHSLGEITALVCAGSIGFAEAVDLVRFRGREMQAAVPSGVGAMAAILGLEDAQVAAACAEAAAGDVVVPVNFNSPGQVVIAGRAAAVARAIEACRARGAKRAVPLPVSVPSHSPLMRPAAERLRERLAGVEISVPRIRVHAFDDTLHVTPDGIREGLCRQLFNPVQWSAVVKRMIGDGVTQVVEAGPGKVLAGLVRRAEGGRSLDIQTIESAASLEAALAACQENAA
jgi:[acyl-carrier-protein] S-malonyltransferase